MHTERNQKANVLSNMSTMLVMVVNPLRQEKTAQSQE